MRTPTYRINPGNVKLFFSSDTAPSLEKVIFSYDPEIGPISVIRGRSGGADLSSGSFIWSPAVKALALLLIKTKIHILSGGAVHELPSIVGEAGSFASSLDYAFSKNPAWLSDMFGVSPLGEPYSKSLILRTNPERKRPGPVIIGLNRMILDPSAISIFIGESETSDVTLLSEISLNIEAAKILSSSNRDLSKVLRSQKQFPASATMREFYEQGAPRQEGSSIHYHHISTPEQVEATYLRCIQRRILNRTYSFMGEGAAQAWIDICNSNSYGHFHQSYMFLDEIKAEIAEKCRGYKNVISIRNGTGVKEELLAREIQKMHDITVTLVDGSPDMLKLSALKILSLKTNINAYLAEFMNPGVLSNVRQHLIGENRDPAVFFLLGNTLCVENQGELIQRLREAMKPEDKLILGTRVSLKDEPDSMDEVFSHWVMQFDTPMFARQTMLSLAPLGISSDQGAIEFEYNRDRFLPSLYRVEHFFSFTQDYSTTYLGKKLYFAKGERILLSFFYQYGTSSVRTLLSAHGMNVQNEFINEQGIQLLICGIA